MDSIAEWIARWHYGATFALLTAEEAGVPLPVPGDLLIAGLGVLARTHGAAFVPTVAVVTAATVCGSSILYTVASRAGRPLLLRVSRRFGLSEVHARRLEDWLERHGALAVVAVRLVPGLRVVTTVAAGALGLDRTRFTLGTLASGAVWACVYFGLGYALGASFEELLRRAAGDVGRAVVAGAGIAGILAVAIALRAGWRHWRARAG